MPAFQIGPCTAAIVSDSGATPSVMIVNIASPGVLVSGNDAVRQLRDACSLALDAAEAFTNPIPSQGTGKEGQR